MDAARPAGAGSDPVWQWTWFAHWPTWHAFLLRCRCVDRAFAFEIDSRQSKVGLAAVRAPQEGSELKVNKTRSIPQYRRSSEV